MGLLYLALRNMSSSACRPSICDVWLVGGVSSQLSAFLGKQKLWELLQDGCFFPLCPLLLMGGKFPRPFLAIAIPSLYLSAALLEGRPVSPGWLYVPWGLLGKGILPV